MNSAAPSIIAAPPPLLPRRAIFVTAMKLTYALASGAFCVWLASFAPAEGPPIAAFVPANAAASLFVRDGGALLRDLPQVRVVQELLNDPDVEAIFSLKARRDEALARYENLPWYARWSAKLLFPPEIESLAPILGRDFEIVSLQPGASESGSSKVMRPALAFARLSGTRGLLVRLAGRFAPKKSRIAFFDLGGGLVAIGFDGATPVATTPAAAAKRAPGAPPPIAQLMVRPAALKAAERKELSVRIAPQLDQLSADGVPHSVLDALTQPPALPQLAGMKTLPAKVELEFFVTPSGGIAARGNIEGDLPMPPVAPMPAGAKVFDEIFLPFDAEACFLRYIESEMRIQGATPTLSKGQRRWSRRFFNLEEREVDLHKELWPAFGKALYVSIEDAPDDINAVGYGVIKASIPFDGKSDRARRAAAELAREKWEDLLDGPAPKSVKPPYVRRITGNGFERYVLMTGQINAPSWTIGEKIFSFTSDAGPFAVRDGGGAPPAPPWEAAPASAYFVRLDGPRSASTAEAIADVWFSSREDALGAREYLEQYPDAELRIKVIKKLTRLLGKFSVEIKPDAQQRGATIDGLWQPGTMVVAEEKNTEESVPPPLPPAGN